MTEVKGNLRKMKAQYAQVVQYSLPIGEHIIPLNELIGKQIEIEYTGAIHCVSCRKETNKSFAQGYCYPCFISVPETAPCILHPEKCEAHKGIYRDKTYAEKHCLRPHYVYLAITAGVKVGVTREGQVPARWIDQGAVQAIKLAKTPDRYTAGMIEVSLKAHFSDKTSWKKMLKNETDTNISLLDIKHKAKMLLDKAYIKYLTFDKEVFSISYPVKSYPQKIKAANLEKEPVMAGKLNGIKGQYLIFENQRVINIRKYGGYEVIFRF